MRDCAQLSKRSRNTFYGKVLNSIGNMKTLVNGREDYDCWKRVMEHTDCAFVETAEVYYDVSHGDGKLY